MISKIRILLVLLTVLFVRSESWAQELQFDDKKLDKYLELLEDNKKLMCNVTLSKGGEVIYHKSIGYRDVEEGLKIDSKTKFRIGSISKMFTTVMIFQLIEEDRLSLDTKLSKFFPEIKNAKKITISNLLNHRSGIYNFTNDSLYSTYMTQKKTRKEMLEIMKSYGSAFEPDSKAKYSNSNYVLLSFIIEDITKNTYQKELKTRVIDKLKLKNTLYGGEISIEKNEAYSYNWKGEWKIESETNMSIPIGAGAIVSTTTDLNKFIYHLFNGDLISEKSLNLMKEIKDGYGRGMFQIPFGERKFYGHNGGIDGFVSHLSYLPDEELTLSLTTNAVNVNFNDVLIGILRIYFNKSFELPKYEQKELKLEESEMKQYEGNFSSDKFPLDIKIKMGDGVLIAQATGQSAFPLSSFKGGVFKYDLAGIEIIFEKNNGVIDYNKFVMKQGGSNIQFNRIQD